MTLFLVTNKEPTATAQLQSINKPKVGNKSLPVAPQLEVFIVEMTS